PKPKLDVDLNGPVKVALTNASATFYQTEGEWTAAKAIDADAGERSGWAIAPQFGQAHAAVFESEKDAGFDGDSRLTFTLVHSYPQHALGRFRISVTDSPRPVRVLPSAINDAIAIAPENRSDAQKANLTAYFKTVAPQLQPYRDKVAQIRKQIDDVKPAVTAIMRELPPDKRRETHVL